MTLLLGLVLIPVLLGAGAYLINQWRQWSAEDAAERRLRSLKPLSNGRKQR